MITRRDPNTDNIYERKFILHIALMDVSFEKDIINCWPLPRFKYTTSDNKIACIYEDSIVDHVFLYPDFDCGIDRVVDNTTLHPDERYWLVSRQLFDRDCSHKPYIPDITDDDGNALREDFFDRSIGESVATARDFLQNKQARGFGYDVPAIPLFNRDTQIIYSQDPSIEVPNLEAQDEDN